MVFEFEFLDFSRCVTGGKGEWGQRRENASHTHFLHDDLEYESLQGVRSCAKCLPCDPGSEVAWTTTALQQPTRIRKNTLTSVNVISPHMVL